MLSESAKKGNIDYVLLITVFALLVFSVIMITSIGVPKSISLSKPSDILFPACGENGVDCYFLLKRHVFRMGIALIAFLFALKIPYRFWRKIAVPMFLMVFALLIIVLVFGSANNTYAKSWINIYNNSIQPTEIAKFAIIFYLAAWMERKGREIQDFKNGFVSFVIVSLFIVLPVLLQPDFGATLVFVTIAASLYFIAGASWRHILLGLLSVTVVTMIVVPLMPHLKHRFIAFMNPGVETCQPGIKEGEILRNYCWQTEQSNIAVGSGGFFGKGLTRGIQKSYWLPQATDDFIFAASAEELGFLRILFVVIAYFVIAYRGFLISYHAPDAFSMLVAAGITAWITLQAFINISVNIGLLPVTGITLPFISYGGTSMVMTLAAIGVLLQISRYISPYASRFSRRRDSRSHSSKYRNY